MERAIASIDVTERRPRRATSGRRAAVGPGACPVNEGLPIFDVRCRRASIAAPCATMRRRRRALGRTRESLPLEARTVRIRSPKSIPTDMTDTTETLIAFDFGEKRIGIAIGQTVTRTAAPLETIPVRGTRPDWNAIDRIIRAWKPDALVVGLPLNMDGTDQWITALRTAVREPSARTIGTAGPPGRRTALHPRGMDPPHRERLAPQRSRSGGRPGHSGRLVRRTRARPIRRTHRRSTRRRGSDTTRHGTERIGRLTAGRR